MSQKSVLDILDITILNDISTSGETTISELSRTFNIANKNISNHITKLESMNLIKKSKFIRGKPIKLSLGSNFKNYSLFISKTSKEFINSLDNQINEEL